MARSPFVRAAMLSLVLLAGCRSTPQATPDPSPPSAEPSERAEPTEAPKAVENGSKSLVVVELFTSEGCSSCPSADAVLATLDAPDVAVLSHHVDYWDNLGWPDPWSSEAATARQRSYSGDGRIFTPQMFVNGKGGFVGSDESAAKKLVASALMHPSAITINATLTGRTVHATLTPPRTDLIVTAVVVLPPADSRVLRGENSGRTLHHVGNVHALVSGNLELPPATPNERVLVFAQEPRMGAIVTATWVGSK